MGERRGHGRGDATAARASRLLSRVGCLLLPLSVACHVNMRGRDGAPADPRLHVRYLGASGFLVEYGPDAVLTAPLFTRPSWVDVGTGVIASNPALVDRFFPPSAAPIRAVLSGHAHYDHLLDVPSVLGRAPLATFYGNRSAQNLLAAHAPDRSPMCQGWPAPWPTIPRGRVVAVDALGGDVVDYSYCPSRRPPGAPPMGRWLTVPGSNVRIMAMCSEHPSQLGPIHYAPGGVDREVCVPPVRASDWVEGMSVSFLVDFLDPVQHRPVYRVYYQDAPTNAPVGLVPSHLLAEKRVDLALLCAGASEQIPDGPERTLSGMAPRFALAGHWEDFSRPVDQPAIPLPMLDLGSWARHARAALPRGGEGPPLTQDGRALPERFAIPQVGASFEVMR